jgi:hypothetical protein
MFAALCSLVLQSQKVGPHRYGLWSGPGCDPSLDPCLCLNTCRAVLRRPIPKPNRFLVTAVIVLPLCCFCRNSPCPRPVVPKQWGSPPGGGGTVLALVDVFILNEIWAQGKVHILVGTSLGWNILLTTQYRYWLRTISSTFCRRLKLEKH